MTDLFVIMLRLRQTSLPFFAQFQHHINLSSYAAAIFSFWLMDMFISQKRS